MINEVTRWDLTEDVATGTEDITPVPRNMEGRFVTYEDYCDLHLCHLAEIDLIKDLVSDFMDEFPGAGSIAWDLLKLQLMNRITAISEGK